MKENLFEMGAHFEEGWSSDNKEKPIIKQTTQIKAPEKHQLYFAKEKRRGKIVTIVQPFHLEKSTLQSLLKTLKKKLGTGGTLREDTLEFQGEVQEALKVQLEAMQYRFKV